MALGYGATPVRVEDDQGEVRESFTAFAAVTGNIATGASTTIQITITRWTTDEERAGLLKILAEQGPDELLDALHEQKETGFARVSSAGPVARRKTSPSERLRYARQMPTEQGRRIVLAFDRTIPFFEAVRSGRTTDYEFTVIVLELDANGEGQGVMSLGTKLSYNKDNNELEIENYSTAPVRLLNVRQQD
jgi:hypothetical protein